MNGMKQPPKGIPIDKRSGSDDTAILKHLRENGRCQQRLLTDSSRHYIFCGGYYHGPAKKTSKGLRCRFHE